jgi:UDP-2-acetamido-2,6-beta-L-arabino-hexul-4-ose reductase
MNIEIKTLEKHSDQRGLLLEILKDNEITESMKQVYFSTTKPGAVRGGHYHHRKIEWFSVVKGKAKIICEDITTKDKKEVILTESEPKVLKIGPPVSHAIHNIGEDDMYLIIVASEVFDPKDPDTYRSNQV